MINVAGVLDIGSLRQHIKCFLSESKREIQLLRELIAVQPISPETITEAILLL